MLGVLPDALLLAAQYHGDQSFVRSLGCRNEAVPGLPGISRFDSDRTLITFQQFVRIFQHTIPFQALPRITLGSDDPTKLRVGQRRLRDQREVVRRSYLTALRQARGIVKVR